MPSSVALLRGINVGGKNLIDVPALAECFGDAGYHDVALGSCAAKCSS